MPRFEYRVWGEHLTDVAGRLVDLGRRGEVRQSAETYVSSASKAVNPKIRASLLDVKVLVDVVDGFEQWEPQLKIAFPVSAHLLALKLFPILGLVPPVLDRDLYTSDEFIHEVVTPHLALSAVEVLKLRVSYQLEGCLAEISDVVVAGRGMQTVAVESEDLAALRVAHERLGLGTHENRSYPAFISETLGLNAA